MRLPVYILNQEKEDLIPFPNSVFLLDVPEQEEKSVKLVEVSAGANIVEKRTLFLVPKNSNYNETFSLEDFHNIGSVGVFTEKEPASSFVLFSFDIRDRFKIESFEIDDNGTVWAHGYNLIEEFSPGEQELPDLMQSIYSNLLEHKHLLEPSVNRALANTNSLLRKMDILANYLISERHERIAYLQKTDNIDRWDQVIQALRTHIKSGKSNKVKKVKETPRTRAEDTKPVEMPMTLQEKLAALKLHKEAKYSIDKELEKLERTNKGSTEYSMLVDYLTWVADLPWNKYNAKPFELTDLKTNLDQSHHGLDDVKDFVLEHFCIERITNSTAGSVLCFVGPPGTGKTSISKQIAEVSGRPLVRIALGGLTDESEIRGHRRTYVASRPGRFIVGLKEARSMDPVFLLDEIDKVGKGHGDPMSALLEILDPEQNSHFVDRYLEFPIDLSKALFICTANDASMLHEALLDRMEMIETRNYTHSEREIITRKYIIPKIIKEYRLESFPIIMTDEVIDKLIATVQIRQIEKKLRKLYRMAAVQIYVMKKDIQVIDLNFAGQLLTTKKANTIGFPIS